MLGSNIPDITDEEAKTLLPLLSQQCRSQLNELPVRQRKRLLTQLREYLDRDAAAQPTNSTTSKGIGASGVNEDSGEAFDDAISSSSSMSSSAKSFVMLLEKRVELEVESAKRRKALAARLKQEDASSRRIALFFTLMVAASAVATAMYLSKGRRMYYVIEFVMQWYHWLTTSQNGPTAGTFVTDGEEYDLYS